MANIGIGINVTENASSIAPRIQDALQGIAEKAEELKHSLDLEELDKQYEQFADRMERIQDQELIDWKRKGVPEGREQPAASNLVSSLTETEQRIAGGITRTGGLFSRLGSSGDALDAGTDAMGAFSTAVGGLGVAGKMLAGIGMVAGSIIFAGNALSKQYEKVMEPVMDLTASFGELADAADVNSLRFLETLELAGDAAARFGYSLEEGMGVMREFAREGMERGAAAQETEEVFGYARGYGIQERERLAQFVGMGRRYGMEGNLLGLVAGGLEQSRMAEGRFMEYLNATLAIFEDGLTRGVVQGFEEISKTQTFFSAFGEQFRGQAGLQRIGELTQAANRATALQSETDVIMYRAARAVAQERTSEERVPYTEVMRLLEETMSPELFKAAMGEIETLRPLSDRTGVTELMRETFGVTYTVADELLSKWEQYKAGEIDLESIARTVEKGRREAESPELGLLRIQNEMKNTVIQIGETLKETKMGILEGPAKILDGLSNMLGAGSENVVNRLAEEEEERVEAEQRFEESSAAEAGQRLLEEDLGEASGERIPETAKTEALVTRGIESRLREVYTPGTIETAYGWGTEEAEEVKQARTVILAGLYDIPQSASREVNVELGENKVLDLDEIISLARTIEKIKGETEPLSAVSEAEKEYREKLNERMFAKYRLDEQLAEEEITLLMKQGLLEKTTKPYEDEESSRGEKLSKNELTEIFASLQEQLQELKAAVDENTRSQREDKEIIYQGAGY